ncbi:MAG: MFS transporter [Christensenella sp.]
MDKSQLWTKNFIMSTLINFMLMLNYFLLMVVTTQYAMTHYNASPGIAGFAASIFICGALVARFFGGIWLERVGRKKMLIIGTIMEVVMSVLYFFSGGIGILFIVRLFHGISYGISSTAIGTIVTDIVPRSRQGEGIGYYMLSVTLGAAIGPFLGMFLSQNGGFPIIFIVCSIAAALCFLCAGFLRVPELAPDSAIPAPSKKFSLCNFFEMKAVPISAVCAIIYFGYSGLLSFLSPFAASLNLQTAANFFFVVYAISMFVSRPFTGRRFDSQGEKSVMLPAFFAFMAGMIILSLTQSAVTLLIAAALLGFGIGVTQSSGLTIAVQASPATRLSLVNSTFYIFLDSAVGIGPLILGLFVPVLGYRGMYFSIAMLTVICILLYLWIYKKKSVQTARR